MSAEGLTEAGIAEIDDVDQGLAEDRGVLSGESFAVVAQRGGGQLSGKLCRDFIIGVVCEGAPEAERVLCGIVEVDIDLAYDGVITAMEWGVEAISAEVQSAVFAVGRAVAARILIEHGEDICVGTEMLRIDIGNILRAQRVRSAA